MLKDGALLYNTNISFILTQCAECVMIYWPYISFQLTKIWKPHCDSKHGYSYIQLMHQMMYKLAKVQFTWNIKLKLRFVFVFFFPKKKGGCLIHELPPDQHKIWFIIWHFIYPLSKKCACKNNKKNYDVNESHFYFHSSSSDRLFYPKCEGAIS